MDRELGVTRSQRCIRMEFRRRDRFPDRMGVDQSLVRSPLFLPNKVRQPRLTILRKRDPESRDLGVHQRIQQHPRLFYAFQKCRNLGNNRKTFP